jgi:hypothetical protein
MIIIFYDYYLYIHLGFSPIVKFGHAIGNLFSLGANKRVCGMFCLWVET